MRNADHIGKCKPKHSNKYGLLYFWTHLYYDIWKYLRDRKDITDKKKQQKERIAKIVAG